MNSSGLFEIRRRPLAARSCVNGGRCQSPRASAPGLPWKYRRTSPLNLPPINPSETSWYHRIHGYTLVVGDAGAGKSLAASRLLQQAIDRALRDATDPIPFFLNARDLHEPLPECIDKKSAGIVRPFQQRTLVILDGIDEVGVSQANELLTQIQCYVDANSNINQHTRVPALNDEDALTLISRIAGRPVQLGEMYGWPESMRDAARRPLFAVMIGSELRRRPGLCIERPVQLINRLAQHVVENSPCRRCRFRQSRLRRSGASHPSILRGSSASRPGPGGASCWTHS